MKKILQLLLLSFLCFSSRAQGLVNFINVDAPAGVNAPVYESDAITRLVGPQFMAELLGGPSSSNLFSIATTGFLTGAGAGYFNGGDQAIPGVGRGNLAWIEVRVWNTASGPSFAQAESSSLPNSWWESPLFMVVAGGGAVNPTPAAPLTGLGTSPVFLNGTMVPEPSTLALGLVCGAVALFWRRRRCSASQPSTARR